MAIAPCGQSLCGRMVGLRDLRDDDGKLAHDVHGQPTCGMTILRGAATPESDGFWRGRITDPSTGSEWRCQYGVESDGTLRLRGYVMVPLLGKSQTWTPYKGALSPDCSMG